MLARRLLLVMIVVLVVSTAGVALIAPRPETTPGTSSTTTTTRTQARTGPSGRLIETSVQAESKEPEVVRMRLGDQLELAVHTQAATQVEIPALGLLDDAAPDAPAHFSILPATDGHLTVRLASGRTVAVVRVEERRGDR